MVSDRKNTEGRVRQIVQGGDCELGAWVEGERDSRRSCAKATGLVVGAFPGVGVDGWLYGAGSLNEAGQTGGPVETRHGHDGRVGTAMVVYGQGRTSEYDPQDRARRFLTTTGGCIYNDLDHPEICLPETVDSIDHVAAWQAILQLVSEKVQAINARLPEGGKLHVHVNNSDGLGNAYGSHTNYLVPRTTTDALFHRKMHHLACFASYLVSSIIVTGQGKVGSENARPPVTFQLSQRADFFETMCGVQTTSFRPIVNSRDEAHCGSRLVGAGPDGPAEALARLHVIFHDNSLCPVTTRLKVGVTQLILRMLEVGAVDTSLILDDPVGTVARWSHDPDLRTRAKLIDGGAIDALGLQARFLDAVRRCADAGDFDGVVPDHEGIIALWSEVLSDLRRGDFEKLAPRLDWVLKRMILERTMAQNPGLDWSSPQIKHLDQVYGSLDPAEGLYLAFERDGVVEQVAPAERVAELRVSPPEDTRAWTRTMLLRLGGSAITGVNWDTIRFREHGEDGWVRYRRLELADPTRFTRHETEAVFQPHRSFSEIVDLLGAIPDHGDGQGASAGYSGVTAGYGYNYGGC